MTDHLPLPDHATGRDNRSGRAHKHSGWVSVAGAAAVLVAMGSLLPIVQGGRWFLTSVVFVAVATLTGSLARRIGLPTAAAALVALTSVPLVANAVAGGGDGLLLVVPTEVSAERVLLAFQDAANQIYSDSVPAVDSPALALLIGASAGVAAVLVDAVAVGLRAPLTGMLLVAALALVPGKALGSGTNGLLLVLVAGAVLLVVAADRRRRGAPSRLPGLAAGGAAAVVLTLLAQVVLPTPFASQAAGGSAPLFGTGVDPLLRLGENLRRGATTPVLSYRTTGVDKDVYLRLAVLEDFTGDVWSPNPATGRPLGRTVAPEPAGLTASALNGQQRTVITPASGSAIGQRLPLPYPATGVSGLAGADFRWEDRGLTLIRDSASSIGSYTVDSAQVDASPAVLRRASVQTPDGDDDTVSLPANRPTVIARTATQWTRGTSTSYDQALAIQNRLRNGEFSYDETTPAEQGYDGDGLNVIATFLRAKAGYCIHYASTMAVMARELGIPSRIVVGYQPGEPQAGTTARLVTSDDLHSWPELFFDGVGWVRFEPTPGRGAAPSYAPLPTASASASTSAATPSNSISAPAPQESSAPTSGPAGNDLWTVVGPVLRWGGITLMVIALLAVPGLLRRLIRRRRLEHASDGLLGAAGSWQELIDSLSDLGLPTGSGRSPRGVEQVLAAHLGSGAQPRAALGRIRAAYERQAYSDSPMLISADDVRFIIGSAEQRVGRSRRLLAAVAPRSLFTTLARRHQSRPRSASSGQPQRFSGWPLR